MSGFLNFVLSPFKAIFKPIFESAPVNVSLIHESVPLNRTSWCAYVLLQDKNTQAYKGTYVQAFYQLAKEGQLQCQIAEKQYIAAKQITQPGYRYCHTDFQKLHSDWHKQLYRKTANGKFVKKNSFELAVIPHIADGDIVFRIGEELNYQNKHGMIPQSVSKVQMMSEYLAWLDQTNLKIVEGSVTGAPILILNPSKRHKFSEKFVHTMVQILGLFVAVSAFATFIIATTPVAALVSLYAMSPVLTLVLSAVVAYSLLQALHLGQFFGLSDLAEFLWNDLRVLTSKHFTHSTSPFSLRKTIKSACNALAIGVLAYVGAEGVFCGILAWPVVAGLGMGGCAIAGTLAGLSFIGTCIGVLGPVRYMNGFGVRNNKIHPDLINRSHISDLKESKTPRPSPTATEEPVILTQVDRLKSKNAGLKAENAELRKFGCHDGDDRDRRPFSSSQRSHHRSYR